MKSLAELSREVALARQTQNLPTSSSVSSVSVYTDILTPNNIARQIKRIKDAFPQLQPGWYESLTDLLKEKNFTDKRLEDAVTQMISEFRYPQPAVAEILSFDKRVKLYTYMEVLDKVNEGHKFEQFQRLETGRYILQT